MTLGIVSNPFDLKRGFGRITRGSRKRGAFRNVGSVAFFQMASKFDSNLAVASNSSLAETLSKKRIRGTSYFSSAGTVQFSDFFTPEERQVLGCLRRPVARREHVNANVEDASLGSDLRVSVRPVDNSRFFEPQ
jgi:hypothetical protein